MSKRGEVKSSGNGRWVGKSTKVIPAQDMRRYDRLPREVRDALKDMASEWACVGLGGLLKKGIPPDRLAAVLRAEDHRDHEALMCAEFGCVP